MFDKNKCWDIFQDAKIDNDLRIYEEKTIENKIAYKFKLSQRQDAYLKLKLLMSLRAIKGELYLQVALRCIRLAKEIFMIEVEEGKEVFIPQELS